VRCNIVVISIIGEAHVATGDADPDEAISLWFDQWTEWKRVRSEVMDRMRKMNDEQKNDQKNQQNQRKEPTRRADSKRTIIIK
jgi:alpha-L-arabinofuranosidase